MEHDDDFRDDGRMARLVENAVARRRVSEMRARTLDCALDDRDVALLSDSELDVTWHSRDPVARDFPQKRSEWTARPNLADATARGAGYHFYRKLSEVPYRLAIEDLPCDDCLPCPALSVSASGADAAYPRIHATTKIQEPSVLTYVEVDTSPAFDTPNLWRYPALASMPLLRPEDRNSVSGHEAQASNLTGRQGLGFNIFRSVQRDADGTADTVRFPFRVSAMRLPNGWLELDFRQLQRHARGLAFGLSTQRAIAEIYAFGRHCYSWGADTMIRSALDTFSAGVGQCGHVNNLIAALMEMNGLRCRAVSGFDPVYRAVNPGGGHSAIEVLDPEQDAWRYVDPYLDILADVSAEVIAKGENPFAQVPVLTLPRYLRGSALSDVITLGQLYRYRTYGDQLSRLPATTMIQLRARVGEAQYGTDWPLNEAPDLTTEELFPKWRTIYVRARNVVAPGRCAEQAAKAAILLSADELPVASPWTQISFDSPMRMIAETGNVTA